MLVMPLWVSAWVHLQRFKYMVTPTISQVQVSGQNVHLYKIIIKYNGKIFTRFIQRMYAS